MPIPSAPPPSNESGALTQPRQLQRWLDVNVVPRLTRTQGYFTIPAFSVNAEWRNASGIAAVFNYTATKNFTLKPFTVPVSPNYLACIAWVDDDYVMHRYKLWSDVGEALFFDCPLYAGQLIKKNFRIEIWNILPDPLTEFSLAGAGNAFANDTYTKTSSVLWESTLCHFQYDGIGTNGYGVWTVRLKSSPSTILYIFTLPPGNRFPVGKWDPDWPVVFGGTPNPYIVISEVCSQSEALNFATSVRGSYDYRFSDDFTIATPSSIVTDFAWPLSGGAFPLPFQWPASSVPVIN